MALKGILKTTKRITNTHEVIGASQGKYKVTGPLHSAPHVEPIAEAQGQAVEVHLGTQLAQLNT